jgi:hypothetical protein
LPGIVSRPDRVARPISFVEMLKEIISRRGAWDGGANHDAQPDSGGSAAAEQRQ